MESFMQINQFIPITYRFRCSSYYRPDDILVFTCDWAGLDMQLWQIQTERVTDDDACGTQISATIRRPQKEE